MYRNISNVFARVFGLTEQEREIRQAIRELRAYSDRELNELGIGRGDIEDVVRYGRRDFDGVPAAGLRPRRAAEVIEFPKAA